MRKEEIKEAYALWKNAVITGDLEWLDKMYVENFSWTNGMGITNSKTQILKRLCSGDLHYLSWIDENLNIYFEGEDAIVKSTQILKLQVYTHTIRKKQHLTVHFIKQNDSWRLATVGESE